MYIKQVIIDGFKSYANRTVVSDFDPQFNAITGLNGSGKSNILDAICFVLGITQLSQVRVANLQGLVYKQGQSGVTKASVSIVFDNSDPKSSPVGYEQFKEITVARQIVIGGRNKYLINGRTAQANEVQNLFHSVQLNVNNPHFLIMQGRITKVLNMKPPEILGMIEEAAGTRMYETKKIAAQKKMEQKQVKVDEIEKILSEEITPKLEKLRSEKQEYLKWAAQNTEMERLQRFVVAYKYSESKKLVSDSETQEGDLVAELSQLKANIADGKEQTKSIKTQQSSLKGSKIDALREKIEEASKEEEIISKELVQTSTKFKNLQQAHGKYVSKNHDITSELKTMETRSMELDEKTKFLETNVESTRAVLESSKKAHDLAQVSLQAANAGMLSGDGSSSQQRTLQEEVVVLESTINECDSLAKTNTMRITSTEKELKTLTKEIKSTSNTDAALKKELDTQVANVAAVEKRKPVGNYDPNRVSELQQVVEVREDELVELQNQYDTLSSSLAAFDFQYEKPTKNFDANKVKGMVAKLIHVSDTANATALEVVAGGKLYQVVVDSVETGKALLEKGKLKKRLTIIPLDKVSNKTASAARVAAAENVAKGVGGNASLALSLVGYDDEVEKAMQYVFGTTLVCDSLATARSVTFNKDVRLRSVTLEGDAFDPQGTLSGGSRPNTGLVLVQLQKLKDVQTKIDETTVAIQAAKDELASLDGQSRKYQKYLEDLDTAKYELSLVQAKADATPYAQLCQRAESLEKNLEELRQGLQKSKEDRATAEARLKSLQSDMKNMTSARDKLVDDAKKILKDAKQQLTKAEAAHTQARDEMDQLVSDRENLQQDREALVAQLVSSQEDTSKHQTELAEAEQLVAECTERYETAKVTTLEYKQLLQESELEMGALEGSLEKLAKEIQAWEVQQKKVQATLNLFGKSVEDAVKEMKSLRAANPWITSEEEFFGKSHTDYDFAARSPDEAIEKLRICNESQAKLSRTINKKVMGMIGKAEEEYTDLNRKRSIIEKDRETIERVIDELDTKKNEALQTTWQKVNKDFGSIFSTLLPGTQAKLDPPEDGTILDGLEVKVAFGDRWKKSLTELSGGQRSLLALSLILALLLFKPAPMYILDEVDAALDLSHTQNIGQMLRNHFAHSQFIVVSLKEGMFNNANVLFRTKFIDGVSTVTRTEASPENREPAGTKKQVDNKKRMRANQNIAINN